MTHMIIGDITKMSRNDRLDLQKSIAIEQELKKREIIALERIATALENS